MPGGWSIPRDVAKLATARAEFNLDVPFGELPGMPAEWAAANGSVHAMLRFGREQGLPIVDVEVSAAVPMTCQRCLGPMLQQIASSSRVAMVATEAQADAVPAEWETVLASDGQLTLAALVAEEVLLTLPVVPRHAQARECSGVAAAALEPAADTAAEAGVEETQRPFADLRALLGKDRPR